MIEKMVKTYVSKLTVKDLERLANENNIQASKDEILVIYQFIQYHVDDLLNENIRVFEEIKSKINPNLYKQLLNTYIDYKQKYIR